MGQIIGCWLYGESEKTNKLQQLYEPIKAFPHANFNFVEQTNLGFGQITNINRHCTSSENLPIYLVEEQILFTAQGLLNNKLQLTQQLQLSADKAYTDESLIKHAYLKWGKSFVHYLNGNWSAAIFDFQEQELIIARDPMGYSSLFFYQCTSGFYFASSIKSILSLKDFTKQLNEAHFVRNLTLWDEEFTKHDTFFKNISSLPPAHLLTLKDRVLRVNQYWPASHQSLRIYKNKQRYADEMLEIFTTAIRSSVNNAREVASMLSGGLDSSAVSVIAANILQKQNKPLTTFSHVPLYEKELSALSGKTARILNEAPLIEEIADAAGNITPVMLRSQNYSVLQGMKDALRIHDAPSHASGNLYWLMDIFRTTQRLGFSTLLSGEGGNGSISFAGNDYLLPFNLKRLVRHPYLFFRNQVVKPVAKKYLGHLLNQSANNLQQYASSVFLNHHILQRYNIKEDITRKGRTFFPFVKDIRQAKERFSSNYFPRSIFGASVSHYFGFDLYDPTTDLELLEYFFSIPNEVFFDDHYDNRMLVKRMMKGKIPDSVLFERKKGLQSADILYRVKAQRDEITEALKEVSKSAAANHYINTRDLAKNWNTIVHGPLVQPYSVHRWLKALQFALFLRINFD